MFTYALAQPRHPIASALQSTLIHAVLVAGAVVATQQVQAHVGVTRPPIDITFTAPHRAVPACDCPVLPRISPVIPAVDNTLPTIPSVPLPVGVPRIDPTTVLPGPSPAIPGDFGGDSISTATILTESEVDELPTLITAGLLRYPAVLAQSGVEGSVTLAFVIDTEGRVEPDGIQVLAATQQGFVPAATEAVLTSRFRPARRGRMPVRVRVRQTITFRR